MNIHDLLSVVRVQCGAGLRDFIDTAMYRYFVSRLSIDFFSFFLFFLANFIEKSDVTISENTEH